MAPEPRIDGWFLCIAPLERPQLAMAVIIEGGGYGGRSAAPVAAALVLKARELGLLGLAPAAGAPAPAASTPQRQAPQPGASPRPASPGATPSARRTPAARPTPRPTRQ
jgi:penicillin-binding protein 2